MTTRSEYYREYKLKMKSRACALFSDKCSMCGSSEKLEFAHKEPTLSGCGRGSKERYREVLNFPERFVRLCRECHVEYDRGKKCEQELKKKNI